MFTSLIGKRVSSFACIICTKLAHFGTKRSNSNWFSIFITVLLVFYDTKLLDWSHSPGVMPFRHISTLRELSSLRRSSLPEQRSFTEISKGIVITKFTKYSYLNFVVWGVWTLAIINTGIYFLWRRATPVRWLCHNDEFSKVHWFQPDLGRTSPGIYWIYTVVTGSFRAPPKKYVFSLGPVNSISSKAIFH